MFVTKDKTGQTVWIETGNENAGLKHILYGNNIKPGHAQDFKKALGLDESKVPEYLYKIITKGEVVENKTSQVGKITGYTRTYYYEGNYYIVTAIGTNGFIVTAYPKKKRGK